MLALDAARSVVVNGAALATLEKGNGDPLTLVHGSASDLRTWSGQFDVLSRRFRTIAYSRRFHSPNTPIPANAPDPIQAHVEDLAALIDRLDAAPVHVVGHSWGALIALLAAEQEPELFRDLILIEPPTISMHVEVPPRAGELARLLVTSPRLAWNIVKFGARAVAPSEAAFRRGDERAAVESFGRGILGERNFEALSEARFAQVWENRGPDRALALFHGFPDLRGMAFASIGVPVLLIVGADSPPLFHHLAEALLTRLPDARLRVIEGASHLVHEDATDAVNAAILDFLDEADQRPATS